MENKLTDNDIIKALDHCKRPTGKHDCDNCPYVSSRGMCTTNMLNDTIDLINRQRETIQNQDEMIRALINAQETLQKEIAKLKEGHILYDSEE